MRPDHNNKRAFSLVELVIVIVILGIIAAVAIPRITSGSRNAGESALRANLASIRNAIDWYYGEHNNVFPGVNDAGGGFGGANSEDALKNQLVKYTKSDGTVSDSVDPAFPYGPYLRGNFPALPVGSNAGNNAVKMVAKAGPVVDGDTDATAGWIFNSTTGEFKANLTTSEVANDGTAYLDF